MGKILLCLLLIAVIVIDFSFGADNKKQKKQNDKKSKVEEIMDDEKSSDDENDEKMRRNLDDENQEYNDEDQVQDDETEEDDEQDDTIEVPEYQNDNDANNQNDSKIQTKQDDEKEEKEQNDDFYDDKDVQKDPKGMSDEEKLAIETKKREAEKVFQFMNDMKQQQQRNFLNSFSTQQDEDYEYDDIPNHQKRYRPVLDLIDFTNRLNSQKIMRFPQSRSNPVGAYDPTFKALPIIEPSSKTPNSSINELAKDNKNTKISPHLFHSNKQENHKKPQQKPNQYYPEQQRPKRPQYSYYQNPNAQQYNYNQNPNYNFNHPSWQNNKNPYDDWKEGNNQYNYNSYPYDYNNNQFHSQKPYGFIPNQYNPQYNYNQQYRRSAQQNNDRSFKIMDDETKEYWRRKLDEKQSNQLIKWL